MQDKPNNTFYLLPILSVLISGIILMITSGFVFAEENDFKKLFSDEIEYVESMNVLGKVIRIFDDKICVEEYCNQGDKILVYIDGNIGLNTKESIKLKITHCSGNNYCNEDMYGTENLLIGNISADNMGGGNFHGEWTIRKSLPEGIYQIEGMTNNKVIGRVGNTMMDVFSGSSNGYIVIIKNIEENTVNYNKPHYKSDQYYEQISKKIPEKYKIAGIYSGDLNHQINNLQSQITELKLQLQEKDLVILEQIKVIQDLIKYVGNH